MTDTPNEERDTITVTADQAVVIARDVRTTCTGLMHLAETLNKQQEVSIDLAQSVLYIAEATVGDVGKRLGVQTESAAQREERYAQIRAANLRVHQLERQLGEGESATRTKMQIRNLADKLEYWWRTKGFGHVSDLNFTNYGVLDARLSCHLFGDFRLTHSETPVSDKVSKQQWHQQLRDQGFVLQEKRGEDVEVVDCDQSREALRSLIRSALPSATIHSVSNHSSHDGGLVMRDVHVYLHELEELSRLPSSPRIEK